MTDDREVDRLLELALRGDRANLRVFLDEAIGHSADHRTEQETWDAIAKQGQPDTNRTEAVTLLEVEPEPREHPGVKHRVRQYEAVGTCAADPPPMKWSALWYGFEPGGRIDVEEATQA